MSLALDTHAPAADAGKRKKEKRDKQRSPRQAPQQSQQQQQLPSALLPQQAAAAASARSKEAKDARDADGDVAMAGGDASKKKGASRKKSAQPAEVNKLVHVHMRNGGTSKFRVQLHLPNIQSTEQFIEDVKRQMLDTQGLLAHEARTILGYVPEDVKSGKPHTFTAEIVVHETTSKCDVDKAKRSNSWPPEDCALGVTRKDDGKGEARLIIKRRDKENHPLHVFGSQTDTAAMKVFSARTEMQDATPEQLKPRGAGGKKRKATAGAAGTSASAPDASVEIAYIEGKIDVYSKELRALKDELSRKRRKLDDGANGASSNSNSNSASSNSNSSGDPALLQQAVTVPAPLAGTNAATAVQVEEDSESSESGDESETDD
jgi:hypothetical protein